MHHNHYALMKPFSMALGVLLYFAAVNTANAQTLTQNFVQTRTPRVAGITTDAALITAASDRTQVQTTVQYIDGLGRPLQTVQVQGSPLGKDIVQPFTYDVYGREATKFLPYAATTADGSYKADALQSGAGLMNFYNPAGTSPSVTQLPGGIAHIPTPYAATNFEPSPLNRTVEQGAPGDAWQLTGTAVTTPNTTSGHTVTTSYGTNAANEVILWAVNSAGNGASQNTGGAYGNYYAPNSLHKTTLTDENGNSTITYVDLLGHTVCKMVQNSVNPNPITYVATYYVYDDLGNLRYVIPPGPTTTTIPTSFTETNPVFFNFIYGYHYDYRNRVVEKKIPGKGWDYIVYNTLDQVVATQDAVQQGNNQWKFTKYDALGRVVMTGIYNNGSINRTDLQGVVNSQTILWETPANGGNGYANNALNSWPTTNITATLSINYYDNYNFPNNPYSSWGGTITSPTGLSTATKTAILNADGTISSNMLWSANFYDALGRVIQTNKQHYLGGNYNTNNYDQVQNSYNFDNQIFTSTRLHYVGGVQKVNVANAYYYDNMGRRYQNYEAINNQTTVLVSQLAYNEIGQFMTKHLHMPAGSSGFLQDINNTYNERGWLRTSTSGLNGTNLFTLDLRYNTPDAGTPKFNGNIMEMHYTGQFSSRVFDYTYDPLNRLTYANSNSLSNVSLDETISYDNMGNITSLTRGGTGNGTLTYAYTGNQLTGVSGFTTRSYGYDANGNATSDGLSKTINYNLFNLPRSLSQSGSTITSYNYDAAGSKLRSTSNADGTWDYISGIVYHNNSIAFIQTEEGRAKPNGTNYLYQYDLKDNLGNARVTFDTDPSTGTARNLQENEYYAFGLSVLAHDYSNGNRYLYNGKELQYDLVNQYDYGARFYDPLIARWNTVDPKTEGYPNWSSYNYVLNNPIKLIDPNGEDVYLIVWGTHDGEIGHAGIAVDNYKTVEVKDKNGKTKLDKNGKPITKQVKDGTVTYHDLWPGGEGANKDNYDKNVPSAYGESVTTLDKVKNSDVSGSEGRAADGVIKFTTDASTDAKVVEALNAFQESNSSYNGLNCNCSDFAKVGVLNAAPSESPLTNYKEKIGSHSVTTPNQLWKSASKLGNATIIKDPGTKVQKTFIEGVTGGGMRQKYAEKRVN